MSDIDDQGGTLVVLTALAVEYQAVRAHLASPDRQRHDHGTIFDVGWLDGTSWRVALTWVGQGNHSAAALTERAVAMFSPPLVAFIGVAGGLKNDVQPGDVVVPTKVYEIHGGKEENGIRLVRPTSWQMRHELSQLAHHVGMTDTWTGSPGSRAPAVHLKPIAAGEVVLNSADSPLRQRLHGNFQDAVAIENESAGVAHAAHLNAALPTLIVRGISDRADGRKDASDAEGWQQTAARNAAAFAFRVIRRYLDDLPAAAAERVAARAAPAAASVAFTTTTPTSTKTTAFPPSAAAPAAWRGGSEVTVADRRYLLHDDHLQERSTSDHALIRRQALAQDLTHVGPRTTPSVWLRQTEERRPTPAVRDAVMALHRESELLARGPTPRDYPRIVQFARHQGVASLALEWPLSRATGKPCRTLDDLLGNRGDGSLDPWRVHRLLGGLAGLCRRPIDWLHKCRHSHRNLTPAGLVEFDDGVLRLRDLGLATHPSEPEEGPQLYQAPEQRRRGSPHQPGPWTDIYQLAAVTYHLVAGTPPPQGVWLPLRAHVSEVPERLDQVLAQAMAHDRAERPDAVTFAKELSRARTELARPRS